MEIAELDFLSEEWKSGSLLSSFCFTFIIGAPKAKHYFFSFCEFLPGIYLLSVHQLGVGSILYIICVSGGSESNGKTGQWDASHVICLTENPYGLARLFV